MVGECIGIHGATLIYGGVDRGLMSIVSQGVRDAGGRTVGIVPRLRQEVRNVLDDETIAVDDLNERKALMLSMSDMFIVLPGGYGTKQIIVLNQNHIYDATMEQFQKMIDEGMMEIELLQRVKVATTAQECCSLITQFISKD